jgi:serine/threonine protein kinase
MTKYQNARNFRQEIQDNYLSNDEIIDCKTILEERNEWLLNEKEFNAKQEFENFGEKNIRNKSYLYSIISILKNQLEKSETNDSENSVISIFNSNSKNSSECNDSDFKNKIIENDKYFRDYKEIEKLGEGKYGVVFKVEEYTVQKICAIKKIKFTIDKEKDLFKELENFLLLKELNGNILKVDGNILGLHDIWIENIESLTLYISMEFCDKNLEKFIQELQNDSNLFIDKTLTLLGFHIACCIFVDILFVVNHLHTREPQILHMDLHSRNIFLKKDIFYNSQNGCVEPVIDVKLADFGLEKICEFAQISQTISSKKGSNYKPSKVLSDGFYSEKNDIYSLAEIMIELFSIDINRYSII